MKKNEEFEIECTDITDQGFGVAHKDGMTLFISNLLPSEKALVKVIKLQKTWGIARVIRRLNDASSRQQPRCPHAGSCGGCSFQHVAYSSQLEYKEKQLKELFERVDPRIDVKPVLGMQEPYFYRNKAQFPIQVKEGKLVSGFYKPRSNDIVDLQSCLIQSQKINEVFAWIKDHLPLSAVKHLRHLFIRDAAKTGEVQVVFIGRKEEGLKEFARKLQETFPDITSIVFNRNERNDNVILGEDYEILAGRDWILEDCLGLKIQLHFKSFYQVNPRQMEVLYAKALELADLKPTDRVIELYSGTGTIGLLASRQAGYVTGVEIVPDAVANANRNKEINQIQNAEFVCMDATEFAHRNQKAADVIFVDPPRKGMTPQGIEDICQLDPQRIVYISCNPRTLARDLEIFLQQNYQCLEIQPVDMFAHSANIECVALLKKAQQTELENENS